MAYCHECGEKVAENDVFCPFCGISITPTAIAGGDDAESKTVAVNHADLAGLDLSPIKNDKINQSPPIAKVEETAQKEEPKINLAGEKSEVSQVDFPPINSEPEKYKFVEKTSPFAADETDFVEKSDADKSNFANPIEETGLTGEKENENLSWEMENIPTAENKEPEIAQTESSLMSYDEAEVKEVLSAETPEKSVEDIPRANFEESEIAAEPNKISESPIYQPESNLAIEEKYTPSKFDSVSIMEKVETPPVSEDEEMINAFRDEKEAKDFSPPPVENKVSKDLADENKEERSFTQPNIGGADTDGKGKTKLKPLEEGTVLNGRYEIIRKIGGGGMGAVYLASDKNLGGVLRAVKEMVQSYIEDAAQEKAVNDFKRESLLLTSLDHQSIPTIFDYFFDEKEARFYLVMKYISGGDLSGRLRSAPEGRIDEASVAKWAVQIADVLEYLHNRQPPIIYRDLKPANIMIDGNSGRAMLIDFGIARWVNKEEKGVTAVGTMGYAPPELFSGNVEPRSDIYSLGSTMFHLLTGADPQSNPLLIFDFQKHPRPRQINPQLSDQIERILMQSVEYSADKRFESATELKKSLEEHLDNLKVGRVTFGIKEAPLSAPLADQPVFCGFCGQKIVATDMFCAFCGAKQPLAQQGVHSENYAPAPLSAQLLIIGTNDLEQPAFRLEKDDNLVGRRDPQSNIFPEVDLSKYDPQTKISRRHARIWRDGNEYMVEDLGSSNGTYIIPVVSDTMRLQPRQPQLLTNGDKLKLGDTTLHFILG